MKPHRFCAASIISAALIFSSPSHAHERSPSPPLPPTIYDPNPGPFLIAIDDQGALAHQKQMEVIDRAWSAWRGPRLEAFSICYFQTSSLELDWSVVFRALENVSGELKTRGAVVFTPASRICDAVHPSVPSGRSYVQIIGLVRS